MLFFPAILFAATVHAGYRFYGWQLSEFQPDILNGGRANTIAVHPTNNDIIIVASDSGGLFRSIDRGATWQHIDGLPNHLTQAVAFVPADPTILIATASQDYRTANGGGIWRSTDGGNSWTQISPPPGISRLNAFEISIAPDTGTIYVGTQYGLSISTDRGATWSHVDPQVGAVLSVVAQRGGNVYAGGAIGVRHSGDGGMTWASPTSNTSIRVTDIHAFGRSPFSPDSAYVVDWNGSPWYTEDAGDHWTRIAAAPPPWNGCGGIAFVKAAGHTREHVLHPRFLLSITLYLGNRCQVFRLTTPWHSLTTGFDYSGVWTGLVIDHEDTRDLAFGSGGVPLLLATDGGLHRTADGGANWTFVGGGRHGYNALQITEVKDQWITALPRHDLYFGTWDNNIWASTDDGATWRNPHRADTYFIEGQHRVAAAANSKITFVACQPCTGRIADPGLTNVAQWRAPASSPVFTGPKIVRESFHVQGVETGGGFSKGFAVTTDLGATWSQYASFPELRYAQPKLSDPSTLPVLYQAILTGSSPGTPAIVHLARIVKNRRGTAGTVTYPAMNNFGGLGINPSHVTWEQVFDVDPMNTQHLIAPDIVNNKMMESPDGGDNWTEIPDLTSQVTEGGTFLFGDSLNSQASAVSFSADDPRLVAVGTWQNGLLVSGDRGATWSKVIDSERATHITSIEWKNATEAVISTYGRGLWRLTWQLLLALPEFNTICQFPCRIEPWNADAETAEKHTNAILVFDGVVQGAKIENRQLHELFVSPGSSVVFFSDSNAIKVKVSETSKRIGFGNVAPTTVEKRDIRGLTLNGEGRVLGAVFTERPLKIYRPTATELNQDNEPVGRRESPTAGKPYIDLPTRAAPLQSMTLYGRSFSVSEVIEISIDDRRVQEASVTEKGRFTVRVLAPRDFGLHTVTARDAQTRKFIAGAMFLVVHQDRRAEKR